MRYGLAVAAFFCTALFSDMINSFRIVSSPVLRKFASSSSVLNPRYRASSPRVGGVFTSVRHFASVPDKKEGEVKGTDLKSKITELWTMYGFVAVGTYATIYVSTLGSVFIAMDYDIFNAATFGFDPVGAVKKVCDLVESATGNRDLPGYIRENPRVGTFAISWVMTKFTEPLRLGLTVAIVPTIARFLGRAPPKESVPK